MRITIKEKSLTFNSLALKTENLSELRALYEELPEGIELEIKVKVARAKRSNNANKYAWDLIEELAEYQSLTPREVYKAQVKEIGKYRTRLVPILEFEQEKEEWLSGHTGRDIEPIGRSTEHPEFIWVKEWYGSSDFDTREMSRFLDLIIFECEQAGIQTESPQKLAEMKEAWK